MKINVHRQVKPAQDVFKKCPRCKASNLIYCEDEAICPDCGWDSIALRVEASFSKSSIPTESAPQTQTARYSTEMIDPNLWD